tara:strand:+ start:714 stop:917 length:204 start_codon:yes stop_codon:yes gene_type:complete
MKDIIDLVKKFNAVGYIGIGMCIIAQFMITRNVITNSNNYWDIIPFAVIGIAMVTGNIINLSKKNKQ